MSCLSYSAISDRRMLIRLDAASRSPLYAQIAAEIRRGIASGAPGEGKKLPPARELADGLGVNMHTVLRAYACLRDEDLIDLRQGRGGIVQAGSRDRSRALIELVKDLVTEARRQKLRPDELLALIERVV